MDNLIYIAFGRQTWPAVGGWPMEIIYTNILEHSLGGQPFNCFAGSAQTKSRVAATYISNIYKFNRFFKFNVCHVVAQVFFACQVHF